MNTTRSVHLDLPSPVCKSLSFHHGATPRALTTTIHEAIFLIWFASLCWALFAGCSVAGTSIATGYSFVTLGKGSQGGVRERKLVVVKSQNDWKVLWNSHASISVPPKEPPLVDFQTEMIVAVFPGEKPTGGYGIKITRIEEDSTKQALKVFIQESKPRVGAILTQSLTQPYHIIKLRQIELPVTFVFQ